VPTDEGQRFFEATTAGKLASALIFARPDGDPWGKNHQQRPLTEACNRGRSAIPRCRAGRARRHDA
jgi:hypothetical protein